jgi:hypothetical protein
MWVRPPISQRLLDGQFHKSYIRIPKIFSTPVINFCVKMDPFPTFSYFECMKKPVGWT